eukprot:622320-Rhodomonas_salina.1
MFPVIRIVPPGYRDTGTGTGQDGYTVLNPGTSAVSYWRYPIPGIGYTRGTAGRRVPAYLLPAFSFPIPQCWRGSVSVGLTVGSQRP